MMLGDITIPSDSSDWWYILLAILIVDVAVIFLVRLYPDVLGRAINVWYERFGLSAVLSDVLIIAIGFFIARYAYTYFMPPEVGFNPWYFIAILVGVQVIHDLLFYLGVILPVPRGHNRMMDVFKDYAQGGFKVVASDTAMMVASALIAMMLKEADHEVYTGLALITTYALTFILETKNKFSEF
jgi:hypothetical protein